jgi:hypothetical protein
VYFVTSVEGEEAANRAMDGMFKFMAAHENDTVRDRTIRQVAGGDVTFNSLISRKRSERK